VCAAVLSPQQSDLPRVLAEDSASVFLPRFAPLVKTL